MIDFYSSGQDEPLIRGLLPVFGDCKCASQPSWKRDATEQRALQVKVVSNGAAIVREVLTSAKVDPQLLLQTIKCKHCGGIALLRLRDLYLAA